MNSSNVLRKIFLNFFFARGHTIVPSASLIPPHRLNLLFTNSGMVPFTDIFFGQEKRAYSRASSIQRCIRAGGKHNDLENVGYTARHHTFFEMLGNFSFGDYFKREAIAYSWQFLTEHLKIAPQRLWVTVFEEDQETEAIWLNEMKIDAKRFSRCGAGENFWSMGDTGPCGPCTEIFYDHGPSIEGGPPGSSTADGDRYVEIWNLVFMQFQRFIDGTLTPLPKPSVDTGMGLERLAAVMQGVTDNYDTDLFQPLLKAAGKEARINDFSNTSLRVIADHIRSCAFLIADGIFPGNEGRSYVLRRIMRRAIRHGHKLGLEKPFFYRLVEPLVQQMRQPYPELIKKQTFIEKAILREEQQFARTLTHGMKLLKQEIDNLQGKQIPGEILFRLYDTYGFPIDLTADVVREYGLTIDIIGFEKEMDRQRNQSKAVSQLVTIPTPTLSGKPATEFTGYQDLQLQDIPIIELFKTDAPVTEFLPGDEGYIVLNQTPFYAEGGGQVGDTGQITTQYSEFLVSNTVKEGNVILHRGQLVKGVLKQGDKVNISVDSARRCAITRNHSATHLLHAALRHILGEHIFQKGSLVGPDRLRFDFSHDKPINSETLNRLEDQVNQYIRSNVPVHVDMMAPEEAKKAGAIAMFAEKYADLARVLTMGEFSKELCGGTHVSRTGDIGLFKITDETGISAGIRRIQAVTGQPALDWTRQWEEKIRQLTKLFKVSSTNLLAVAEDELNTKRALQKQIKSLQRSIVSMMEDELLTQTIEMQGIRVLISEITGVDALGLRHLVEQLKNKLPRSVILLASTVQGHTQLTIGVSKELTDQIKANELASELAQSMGGKGGGQLDFAQVGSNNTGSLESALKKAKHWVEARLNGNYA